MPLYKTKIFFFNKILILFILCSLICFSCQDKFGGRTPAVYSIYLEADTTIKSVIISYTEKIEGDNKNNHIVTKEVELPFKKAIMANYYKGSYPEITLKVLSTNDKIKGILFQDRLNYDSLCSVDRILGIVESTPNSKCTEITTNQLFEYLNNINYPCIIDASKNKLEVNLNDWKGNN
jgi:hypothetical protein